MHCDCGIKKGAPTVSGWNVLLFLLSWTGSCGRWQTRRRWRSGTLPAGQRRAGQISMNLEESVAPINKYDIIKKKLDDINPLELSPMEALNVLYELKSEMDKKD